MDWYLVLEMACLVALSIVSRWLNVPPPSLYKRWNALLSPAERAFFGVLQTAVARLNAESYENEYVLFTKVRIADVITPNHKANSKAWWRAFNRISQKHFDFLLCDANTMKVLVAIELDDKSHQSTKAQRRDSQVDTACHYADLPLARFPAKRSYTTTELQSQLLNHLLPQQFEVPKERIGVVNEEPWAVEVGH